MLPKKFCSSFFKKSRILRTATYTIAQAQVGDKYSSVFTDQLVFPGPTDDFDVPDVHNDAYYFRDNMNQDRCDPIRDSERFKAVLAKPDEYAR